jgi:hypothetical protein
VDLYGPRERDSYVLDLVYIKIILIIIFLLAERYHDNLAECGEEKRCTFPVSTYTRRDFSTLALSLVLVCRQAGRLLEIFICRLGIN